MSSEDTALLPEKRDSRRNLTAWHVATLAFFCVGGGPFGFEESLGATQSPALSFWALVLMGVFWAFPMAMSVSELSTIYQHGYTEWVISGLGQMCGVVHGWLRAICNVATNISYASLFADYYISIVLGDDKVNSLSTGEFIGWRLTGIIPYVAIILGGNLSGVRLVGNASIIFTLLSLSPFLMMFGLTIAHGLNLGSLVDFSGVMDRFSMDLGWSSATAPVLANVTAVSVSAASTVSESLISSESTTGLSEIDIGLLLSILVFNLIGWDDVGNLSSSVKKLERDLPIGIFCCILLVMSTYTIPLICAASVLDPSEYSSTIWIDTAHGLWYPLGVIVSVDSLVSVLGLGFVYMTTSSEAHAHCSDMGLIPEWVAQRSKKYFTPWLIIIIQSVCVLVFSSPFTYDQVVTFQSWYYTLSVIAISTSWIIIRWRRRHLVKEEGEFKMNIPWVVALMMVIIICAFSSMVMIFTEVSTFAVCIGFLAFLFFVALYCHKMKKLQRFELYQHAVFVSKSPALYSRAQGERPNLPLAPAPDMATLMRLGVPDEPDIETPEVDTPGEPWDNTGTIELEKCAIEKPAEKISSPLSQEAADSLFHGAQPSSEKAESDHSPSPQIMSDEDISKPPTEGAAIL